MEPLPDLATLSDEDLKKLIDELTQEEHEVSYRRRLLHGKIDILRAELVARLHARGSNVPWRMVRARGSNVEAIDEYLRSKGPSGPQGVTTAMNDDGGVRVPGIAHRPLGDESGDAAVRLEAIA